MVRRFRRQKRTPGDTVAIIIITIVAITAGTITVTDTITLLDITGDITTIAGDLHTGIITAVIHVQELDFTIPSNRA